MSILTVENLRKVYSTRFGGNQVEALKNVNFSVDEGEYVAIMGESGSRQDDAFESSCGAGQADRRHRSCSTARSLAGIKESGALPTFRRDNLGFVFQEFNLLDTFTIQDNILLPLVLAGKSYDEMSLAPAADSAGCWASDSAAEEISLRGLRRPEAARRRRPGAYHKSAAHPRRRADGRARLQERPTSCSRLFEQINTKGQTILMVTHSVKAAVPRAARAVHQRRRGVPPDLPRRKQRSAALPEDLRHADHSCIGR